MMVIRLSDLKRVRSQDRRRSRPPEASSDRGECDLGGRGAPPIISNVVGAPNRLSSPQWPESTTP
jgi:hypothetical protein